MDVPVPPAALKIISPYMKLAKEYDKRDEVVAYYCRVYCIQKGISTDSKSPDCKQFLLTLMDVLEKAKKDLAAKGAEAVTNEIVGQAHVEGMALNLFAFADQEDRKSNFTKGLVKSFYSANLLFDVLKQFGEISEEITLKQKYAKWKATYIHKCLQTGEAPVPGPQGSEFDGAEFSTEPAREDTNETFTPPYPPQPHSSNQAPYPPPSSSFASPGQPSSYSDTPPSTSYSPPVNQAEYPKHQDEGANEPASASNSLGPDEYQKATKYCKYAISSLQYEDVSTAIENLTKALKVLKSH